MTLLTGVKSLAASTLAYAFIVSLAPLGQTQIFFPGSITLGRGGQGFLTYCREGEFICQNGECIRGELLCDGRADCSDYSDETPTECKRFGKTCPSWAFRCDYGACVSGNAICNGVQDCLDNSDELLLKCLRSSLRLFLPYSLDINSNRGVQPLSPSTPWLAQSSSSQSSQSLQPSRPSQPFQPSQSLRPSQPSPSNPSPTNALPTHCLVPPQPLYGEWKLHKKFCDGNENCRIPQGIALQPGTRLVYRCAQNFFINGNADVYCVAGGNWSSIPTCIGAPVNPPQYFAQQTTTTTPSVVPTARCSSLNSISRAATCARFGDRVSCESPVPHTTAKVTCRINYGLARDLSTGFEQDVECRPDGRWEPEPITCNPVCGVANGSGQLVRAIDGTTTDLGVLPWHANLWRETNTPQGLKLEFQCSATIIQANFALTAGHCVNDATTGAMNVFTGLHVNAQNSPSVLYKVKNVYKYCQNLGQINAYASDVALVELQDPFTFSPVVFPACLDVSSNTGETFHPGTTGKIVFNGRSSGTPNTIPQTAEVTYVSNSECKAPYNVYQGNTVISDDKFCGVFSNISATTTCDWVDGSGFVSKKGELWHLMGVFVTDLGSGLAGTQRTCREHPYSLYTKVSPYMAWIQDVMFQLKQNRPYPPCSSDVTPLAT